MTTGGQWDLVQVVAWGRMFTGYSGEMSLSAAAKKTFSGEMCGICHVAQDGKKQQESNNDTTPQAKVSGKLLDLTPLTASVPVLAPVREPIGTIAAVVPLDGRERASPPSPPPRV